MGKDLWDANDTVKKLFADSSDITGVDMQKLLFTGTEEDLKATDKTQIAIILMNLSAGIVLKDAGITPDGSAGFSLGEYSALYEAGVIRLEDLFPIVKARGELMEKASREADASGGKTGMAAVIGISLNDARGVLEQLEDQGVYLANYNSPVQIVLSGTAAGLDRAEPLCKDAGARRFIRLRVSGPFHSPLIHSAKTGLQKVLEGYTFSDPTIPVYANVTGKRITSGREAKELCVRQIDSTVRWVDEEAALLKDGFAQFFEVGPGKVLSGLWKAFDKDTVCRTAGTVEEIRRIAETM